ncbi:MAG: hypothetical protein IJH87_04930 [Atopobiaceae bacterium]|nr:hypothetical protein [Atopobiaceae bacterium]
MRDRFGAELVRAMEADERIVYLTGDVANSTVAKAADRLGNRFLNCGIAEQSMMGIAAGMALEGKTVVVNSIGNFPTQRCLEQIRDDVCYHDLDVKVCAVGGGFAYGVLGVTHNATEDLSVMRAMPHMACFVPGDPDEAAWATHAMLETDGPVYLRIGYHGEPMIPKPECFSLGFGRAACYLDGDEVAILACGSILAEGYRAALALREQGVSCALLSFPTLKPIDAETIRMIAGRCPLIITLEENVLAGGFGSAVAEVVSEMDDARARLMRMGLDDAFPAEIGSAAHLREHYGLDAESIVARIRAEL